VQVRERWKGQPPAQHRYQVEPRVPASDQTEPSVVTVILSESSIGKSTSGAFQFDWKFLLLHVTNVCREAPCRTRFRHSRLRQLRYLVALEETHHFREAAESCGISQPSLSVQIKTLEDALDQTLVERGRGPVRLTMAGREVARGGARCWMRRRAFSICPSR
jgi:hypothetical protein